MSDFIIVDSIELQLGYLRVFVEQVCVYDNLTITLTRRVIWNKTITRELHFFKDTIYILSKMCHHIIFEMLTHSSFNFRLSTSFTG